MYSFPTRVARLIFVLFFDIFQAAKGYVQLGLGHHNIVYSNREGGLARRQSYRRVAVFAIYAEASALPFMKNLLNALAAENFFVLVVSTKRLDRDLSDELVPLCHQMIERYPMGRDFGSYRIGLQWIERQQALADIDTLALVNDSLFYPKEIAPILKALLAEPADWLALYENFQYHYHAQSFFQIFRTPVFSSPAFRKFWRKYRPLSSRKHSINKGEVGLSRTLRSAGFLPYVLYSTVSIKKALMDRLHEDPQALVPNLIVRRSGGRDYFDSVRRFRFFGGRESLDNHSIAGGIAREYGVHDVADGVAKRAESENPTHRLGLLCNYLYGAPIKRDICFRGGMHTIADVMTHARGFDQCEMDAMLEDLRRKGVQASMMRGLRWILFSMGRI